MSGSITIGGSSGGSGNAISEAAIEIVDQCDTAIADKLEALNAKDNVSAGEILDATVVINDKGILSNCAISATGKEHASKQQATQGMR